MTERIRTEPDETTRSFFDRQVDEVAVNLGDRVYRKVNGVVVLSEGRGKILVVPTPEGDQEYQITCVEAYDFENAAPIWKGKRAAEIRDLFGGDTITYRTRSGTLTFAKVQEANNILIRGMENLSTGEKLQNATQVSNALGVTPGDIGRLAVVDQDRFRFVRPV